MNVTPAPGMVAPRGTGSTRGAARNGTAIAAAIAALRVLLGYLFGHVVISTIGYTKHLTYSLAPSSSWSGLFFRWDARYFVSIAQSGYPPNQPALAPFFPGYPLLVRALHALTFGSLTYIVTAEVISAAAFIAAAGLMYAALRRFISHRQAMVTVFFFAFFPTSFFFFSPYPESLIILEFVAILYLLDREHFAAATAVAAVASLTSLLGVAAAGAVALSWLLARRDLLRAIASAVLGSMGTLVYMAFLLDRFGDPILFIHAQKYWHRTVNFPWLATFMNLSSVQRAPSPPANNTAIPSHTNYIVVWLMNDAVAVLGLILFIYVAVRVATHLRSGPKNGLDYRRLLPWGILFLTGLLVPVSSSIHQHGSLYDTESTARLISVCVPIYPLTIHLFKRSRLLLALLVTGTFISSLGFQLMFNRGFWLT